MAAGSVSILYIQCPTIEDAVTQTPIRIKCLRKPSASSVMSESLGQSHSFILWFNKETEIILTGGSQPARWANDMSSSIEVIQMAPRLPASRDYLILQ